MDSIQRRLVTNGVALAAIISGTTLVTADRVHAGEHPVDGRQSG
jgi:hypothetical protein